MHEIDVFLLRDKPKSKPYIKVQPDLIGVHSGDTVFWNLHSLLGKDVKWVEIEFASAARVGQFFECRDHDPPETKCHARLHWGHGHLLGTAPELGKTGRTARAKYFVRGYRSKPNPAKPQDPIVELDPDIIVCDP